VVSDDLPAESRRRRCVWCLGSPEYIDYHDLEWGRPVVDDRAIYEKICLEGFQSGLSWITILRKREGFRRAFVGFDPEAVARFGPTDVERLLADAGIVRHQGKIDATITNARALLGLWSSGETLGALLWGFEPARRGRPVPTDISELPSSTVESTALSKELRRRGFVYVGPTTAYSAMQALGVVNDHVRGCHVRSACDADRRAMGAVR
jgi:DNA-3-methyladenine glycosylase I